MTILILGHEDDPQVSHIRKCLLSRGRRAFIFDGRLFPSKHGISFDIGKNHCTLLINDIELPLSAIRAVYWHKFYPPQPVNNKVCELTSIRQNCLSALNTFLHCPHIKWVNSIDAVRYHQSKPLQLGKVKALGANVPETIISSIAIQMNEFVNTYLDCIVKPVYGGAFAERISSKSINLDYWQQYQASGPTTLQRYIAGTNIRTFVCGAKCASAELISKQTDFRSDCESKAVPHTLTTSVKQLAIKICRQMNMAWGAIDWRLDKEGNYWFLEINPAPYFLRIEHETGLGISEMLVEELVTN